jgi:hypothetical protein
MIKAMYVTYTGPVKYLHQNILHNGATSPTVSVSFPLSAINCSLKICSCAPSTLFESQFAGHDQISDHPANNAKVHSSLLTLWPWSWTFSLAHHL